MPVHFIAWQTTMRRHGIEFTEEQFYKWGGRPTLEIIDRLSKMQNVEIDADAAAVEKEQAFKDRIDQVQIRPEVVAAADAMRAAAVISVASGGDRDTVTAQLQHTGLDWIEIVITAEDTERHKPHPDPFLLAAERMQISPADCLVWEDSPLGITAAADAGMSAVDVRGTPQDWVWHEHPAPQ